MSDVDYGPLAGLIGTWKGDKGMDISPEPDGQSDSPYFETIVYEAGGDVTNAEAQTLAIVPYHQVVSRHSNGEVFHDERGYWLWDSASQVVMHSLVIPRAVAVLAGGVYGGSTDPIELDVAAELGSADWGILQSPFMRDNARTTAFRHHVELAGDALRYSETTVLEIYGKTFEHTDANALVRA